MNRTPASSLQVARRWALCLLLTPAIASAETLQEVIEKTLQNSPEIHADRHGRAAARHALDGASAGYRPTVNFEAAFGSETSDNASTQKDRALTRSEASLTGTQMLFDGWRTLGEVERGEARLAAAGHVLEDTTQSIALRAVEVVLGIQRGQRLQALAEENLKLHETIEGQISERMRAGVTGDASLKQVQGRRARAGSDLITAETRLRDAYARYIRVVGNLPQGDLETVPEADCTTFPGTVDGALDRAYAHHPALQSAMARFREALAEERIAYAALSPEFNLELSATRHNDIDGINAINEDQLVMFRMAYNVLNGGRDQARIREVRHRTDQAVEQVNQVRRAIRERVEISWNALEALQKRLPILEKRRDATVLTREAYMNQFNIGQRTLLDLLDVGGEQFTASSEHAELAFDTRLAAYRLLADMGGLLDALGVKLEED